MSDRSDDQHETIGWRRLSSRYLFQSRWFNIRQDGVALPNGAELTYTLVEHPGFSIVVPVLDDGQVILERLYRYTLQRWSLECPAGGLDGDDPETAARRELREETGYVASRMVALGSFNASTGISNEVFHVFLATGLEDTGQTQREATEQQMEIVRMPLGDAVRLAMTGEISDSSSVLALILAKQHHES